MFNVCKSMKRLNECRVVSVIDTRDDMVEIHYDQA